MKGKGAILICIILAALIGWSAGYLRLPYIERSFSYLIGFTTALAIVCFGAITIIIWNKSYAPFQILFQRSNASSQNKNQGVFWLRFFALLFLVSFITLIFFYVKYNSQKSQLNIQNQKINQLTKVNESLNMCNLNTLLNDIYNEVEEEVLLGQKRSLSEHTIERIIALNYTFKAQTMVEADQESANKWSVERGHLLIRLASMEMDSSSFRRIKTASSFEGADLRNANLSGTDLSRIDLKFANLKGANLNGVNLDYAILSDANLWGANLQDAHLKSSDLQKADLRWANLSKTDLRKSNLNGANLSDAKLESANLQQVNLKGAKAINTYLQDVNFTQAILSGTDFESANLTLTKFNKAKMDWVNFSDAIFYQTNLCDAKLSKVSVKEIDWIQNLNSNQVVGSEQVDQKYKAIKDVYGMHDFRLEEK